MRPTTSAFPDSHEQCDRASWPAPEPGDARNPRIAGLRRDRLGVARRDASRRAAAGGLREWACGSLPASGFGRSSSPGRRRTLLPTFGGTCARGSDRTCCEPQTTRRLRHAVWGTTLLASMNDAVSSLPRAPSERDGGLPTSGAFNDRGERLELAALYSRVADTLERSAQLADEHAERERNSGRGASAEVELERARRARAAACRGRELASRLKMTLPLEGSGLSALRPIGGRAARLR